MFWLLKSRGWPARGLRIVLFAGAGWWLLQQSGWLAHAGSPWRQEWPHTDFSRRSVDLTEIISGGPPKDGIPAIDQPRFVSVDDAAPWLDPSEPVILLEGRGAGRAYPLQILMWHEIVNDRFQETPVAVTFCPLCNAAIVFDRRVGGAELDFGTTGKLRHSDMVMYDRQSESWWQQFTGKGIVGRHVDVELRQIPSKIIAFEAFRGAYPRGEVLSRDTGYRRAYGSNPYRGYDRVGDQPFLLQDPADPRLPAMVRVLGVTVGEKSRVYPFSLFQGTGVLQDELSGIPLVIFHQDKLRSVLDQASIRDSRLIQAAIAYDRRLDGRRLDFQVGDGRLTDSQTDSQWDLLGRALSGPLAGSRLQVLEGGVHFAFAWLAFRPDTEIYGH